MARDIRVPMAPLLRAFGVDATVTRPAPNDDPIETTGVWVPVDTAMFPQGSEWPRRDQLRVIAFDVDEVPTLPRGTLIEAPERAGESAQIWFVDGPADSHAIDADQRKVIVRLQRSQDT